MQTAARQTVPQAPFDHAAAGGDHLAVSDAWNLGNPNFTERQIPGDLDFSEIVEVRSAGGDSKSKALIWLFLALLAAVGGYGAYEYFVNEVNPLEEIMALINGGESNDTASVQVPRQHKSSPKVEDAGVAQSTEPASSYVPGNPYWALPNKLTGPKTALARPWSAEEEDVWRAQIGHQFSYQRWQAVMDIRKRQLSGSDVLLWEALQDKKFWTRMYAAVGLAEFNIELSIESLDSAIGQERSELIANFFERFVQKPNQGQAFIMRQAVRLLDERGRLVALRGIDRVRDPLSDLYLVAATLDPGEKVQRWVERRLMQPPTLSPERFQQLLAVVEGRSDGEGVLSIPSPSQSTELPRGPKTGPTDKSATSEGDLLSETSIDELSDDMGDVEFYDFGDEATTAVTSETDDETFEYDYEFDAQQTTGASL